jgi:hypothetical protein
MRADLAPRTDYCFFRHHDREPVMAEMDGPIDVGLGWNSSRKQNPNYTVDQIGDKTHIAVVHHARKTVHSHE